MNLSENFPIFPKPPQTTATHARWLWEGFAARSKCVAEGFIHGYFLLVLLCQSRALRAGDGAIQALFCLGPQLLLPLPPPPLSRRLLLIFHAPLRCQPAKPEGKPIFNAIEQSCETW